jgi:putative intracellular protease/amidase
MKRLLLPVLFLGATAFPLYAQTAAPSVATPPLTALPATPVADTNGTAITQPGPDPKGGPKIKVVAPANLFEAPTVVRPLKIGVYFSSDKDGNAKLLINSGKRLEGADVSRLDPADFATKDLSQFDIIVFSGGSGSAQAKSIGEEGKEAVRKFVRNGGGYLGICAGAYLASSGYSWSLNLLNSRTLTTGPKGWIRGGGAVNIEVTDEGASVFGPVKQTFPIRYNNGPIVGPASKPDLPPYKVAAWFRTELAENGNPVGLMVNTPAAIYENYGKGRVMAISPHAEGTKNMDNFLPRALVWLGGDAPAAK